MHRSEHITPPAPKPDQGTTLSAQRLRIGRLRLERDARQPALGRESITDLGQQGAHRALANDGRVGAGTHGLRPQHPGRTPRLGANQIDADAARGPTRSQCSPTARAGARAAAKVPKAKAPSSAIRSW